jgi:hypothetical protein
MGCIQSINISKPNPATFIVIRKFTLEKGSSCLFHEYHNNLTLRDELPDCG